MRTARYRCGPDIQAEHHDRGQQQPLRHHHVRDIRLTDGGSACRAKDKHQRVAEEKRPSQSVRRFWHDARSDEVGGQCTGADKEFTTSASALKNPAASAALSF